MTISVQGDRITKTTDDGKVVVWDLLEAPRQLSRAPMGHERWSARALCTMAAHPPLEVTVTLHAEEILAWQMGRI